MKKPLYLIILIALLAVAAYFFFSQKGTTLTNEFSDFAIEDTSKVDRIFISDFNGVSVDLKKRKDDSWEVNDKYKARKDAIDLLLFTFKSIKVKEMIPKPAVENTIKKLAATSTKVEIYCGENKPTKVYYVGGSTKNHFGTYMLLEIDGKKSSQPYITHIQGFHGYLTERFFTIERLWRDRSIFNYPYEDIARLIISYTEKPLKSFELKKTDKSYQVFDGSTKEEITPVKEGAITEFLSRFNSIYFEYIPEPTSILNIDSVTASTPLHTIELQSVEGKTTTLKTYLKPVKESMMINPETGETYNYDLDRLYAWINETDFVVMQWPTLDKILAYNDDFRMTEIVDN